VLPWCLAAACAKKPSDDAGPPIADPRGPFEAELAPDRPLADLSVTDCAEVCGELGSAAVTFLDGAVAIDKRCAARAEELTRALDASTDDARAAHCAELYARCKVDEAQRPGYVCPLAHPPQRCTATIADLSACLNQLAAAVPVSACVTWTACGNSEGAPPQHSRPVNHDVPACVRLHRICPDLAIPYPC